MTRKSHSSRSTVQSAKRGRLGVYLGGLPRMGQGEGTGCRPAAGRRLPVFRLELTFLNEGVAGPHDRFRRRPLNLERHRAGGRSVMASVFDKLSFKDQPEILVVNAPPS